MGDEPGMCAVVACARPRHSRGLCTLHYKRWWSGRPLTGPQRFAGVVYACRTCGATWSRLPGSGAQPAWCSQECRLGVPRVVQPLAAGTLAVSAAVLVSVERGATHAGLARALGVSIPRVEQHLATARALLAGRPRDRLDDDAVLSPGHASRSIGVTPDVLEQRIAAGAVRVVPRSNGVGLAVDEVRRLRCDLLLELLARHLDQINSRSPLR